MNIKKVKQRVLLTIFIVLVLSGAVYCETVLGDSFDIVPYKTIFDKNLIK